jgi:hypothetical protein
MYTIITLVLDPYSYNRGILSRNNEINTALHPLIEVCPCSEALNYWDFEHHLIQTKGSNQAFLGFALGYTPLLPGRHKL